MAASGAQPLVTTKTLDRAVEQGFLVSDPEGGNALRGEYRRWCRRTGTTCVEVAYDRDDDCWHLQASLPEGREFTAVQRESVEGLAERLGVEVETTGNRVTAGAVPDAETARDLADGLDVFLACGMRWPPDEEPPWRS